MIKKFAFMLLVTVLTCSCTRYSHDRIQEIGINAAVGSITSEEIDELLAQSDCMLDDAIDRIEAYIRSDDNVEKADMISTLWEDAHIDDMKFAFDILRAPDIQEKMNKSQLKKFESLQKKFIKLKYRVDMM